MENLVILSLPTPIMENIHTLVFQVKSEEGKGAVDKLRAELDTGRFLFSTHIVVGATL